MAISRPPNHPALQSAWEYEIVGINLDLVPDDGGEPRLDLKVRKGNTLRVFRFWSPADLEIERGGPRRTSGLVILDLSDCGLENIAVLVDDLEAGHGAVRFVAREVEELGPMP